MTSYPAFENSGGERFVFCSVRHSDEWYLRIRDPQSARLDEGLAFQDWEPVERPANLGEFDCAWCHTHIGATA